MISVMLEAQTAPKCYVYSDLGDFAGPESYQTLCIWWFRRFRRSKKLQNVTYLVISDILEVQKAPKRYVYSDFGDFGGPESSQTLHI